MSSRPQRGHAFAIVPLVFAAIGGLMAACSIGLSSGEDPTNGKPKNDVTFNESDAPSEARATMAPGAEAATSGAADAGGFYRGSPLCSSSGDAAVCSPDDTFSASAQCGAPPADEYDASARGDAKGDWGDASVPPPQPLACRVHAQNQARVPVCSPAGSGGDGAECLRSADCSAGFECVRSPGRCRRYCCEFTCNADESFCNIEPTAPTNDQPGILVPVCGATRPCKLLGGACDSGETCAVVKQDGTTSCVSVGKAAAGEDCERDHCGVDFSCLGQPGSRRCYRLCLVNDMRSCPTGQTCRGTAPLFKDPNVGVCE